MKAIRSALAPDIVTSRHARHGGFLQFLAFGFEFGDVVAKDTLEHIDRCRREWIANHGETDLDDDQMADLLVSIARDAVAADLGKRPLTLGLTSGYDSRPLLWAYRQAGIKVHTNTWGCPGKLDWDLVRWIDNRMNLGGRFDSTNTLQWALAHYDDTGEWVKGLPISPRLPTARILDSIFPGRTEIHGYSNQIITRTSPHPPDSWDLAREGFVAANDPFALQRYLPAALLPNYLPRRPLMHHNRMRFDRQLAFGYRSAQRLLPRPGGNHTYALPYVDERWLGYWLSRPPELTDHQRRWIRFLHTIDDDLFCDLRPFRGELRRWALQKLRLRFVYGGDSERGLVDLDATEQALPDSPTEHFSARACFRNNPSFRDMVRESLARLASRRVFDTTFVSDVSRRFEDGDGDASKQLLGLVSADIALEAGLFA